MNINLFEYEPDHWVNVAQIIKVHDHGETIELVMGIMSEPYVVIRTPEKVKDFRFRYGMPAPKAHA